MLAETQIYTTLIETYTCTQHTSARCCGLLTLISAFLVRILSSVSMTSAASLGDDQHSRQECLRKVEREQSFFQSAFPPSSPCSCDASIFSCCIAGSSIAALPGCRYTAEEAEPPLSACLRLVCVCTRMDGCLQADCTTSGIKGSNGMSQAWRASIEVTHRVSLCYVSCLRVFSLPHFSPSFSQAAPPLFNSHSCSPSPTLHHWPLQYASIQTPIRV